MIDHVKGTAQTRQRTNHVGAADGDCNGEGHPEAAAADELRTDRRVKTRLKGVLLVEGGSAGTDCLVRDLSDGGAKIEVDPIHQIAPNFTLEVPDLNTAFQAELRWRYAQTAGVKFTARKCLIPNDEHPTRAELIAEIAQLRETVQGLTDRLRQLGERVVDGAILRGRVPQRFKGATSDVGASPKRTTKSGRTRRGEGANSLGKLQ